MTVLALTEPQLATPRRWDGFVKWLWIGLAAIVCSLVGVLEFGVLGVMENADELPIVMALATAAQPVESGPGGGYVDHAEWATSGGRPSLRVYPTAAGRRVTSRVIGSGRAWAEVLRLVPDAGTPGMREQFACHWRFAEFGKPGKTSWNLEPWRPLVGDITMIASRCNPGGNEESY